jgi:hypothetical protein
LAIIAIDTSGIVGDPPIYIVGARLKRKNGRIVKQFHNILLIEKEVHDNFIDKASRWKLKLSAVLIYNVLCGILKVEDEIIMDVDFQANEDHVKRYLKILGQRYHYENHGIDLRLEFGNCSNESVFVADQKSKRARKKDPSFRPNLDIPLTRLTEQFNILARVH